MNPTPQFPVAGVTLGEPRRIITSSKRMTWINSVGVCFNKSRTEFFAIFVGIPTRSQQELEGGVPAYPLSMDDATRDSILEHWRAGRREWIAANIASGVMHDGRNDGVRLVADNE